MVYGFRSATKGRSHAVEKDRRPSAGPSSDGGGGSFLYGRHDASSRRHRSDEEGRHNHRTDLYGGMSEQDQERVCGQTGRDPERLSGSCVEVHGLGVIDQKKHELFLWGLEMSANRTTSIDLKGGG